jgi:hypothetical protein
VADGLSDDWDIIRKKGFLLSVSAGGEVMTEGITGGGVAFFSSSWLPTVDAWGVIC